VVEALERTVPMLEVDAPPGERGADIPMDEPRLGEVCCGGVSEKLGMDILSSFLISW